MDADPRDAQRPASYEPFDPPARILVVDDVPTVRRILKGALGGQDFQVVEAGGGEAALRQALAEEFDLVVLDVLMPDRNGLDVLRDLRQTYTPSELPIIVVTVKDRTEDVVQALALGANDYVVKPVDLAVFLARVYNQVGRKRAEQALRQAQSDLERRIQDRTEELIRANERLSREVEERREMEQALLKSRELLRLSEQRYRSLYDDHPSMFFTVDAQGVILSANRYGAEQLGYRPEELVGRPATELDAADATPFTEGLGQVLAEPDAVRRWETRLKRRDGSNLWVRQTARVAGNGNGGPTVLLVCEDITDARRLSEQLTYQATHDSLTHLVNRREFENRLRRVLDTAKAGDSEHALCYLDLDQFKVVNDNCGHVGGDALLRQISDLLQSLVRKRDTVARLGGDEFGVLMEHCSLTQAWRVADGLRKAVQDFRFVWQGATYGVGVSIGLVPISRDSGSLTEILKEADAACYAAKDKGRNRIQVYRAGDSELARRHGEIRWVARLQRAMEQERLRLWAQPIVPIAEDAPTRGEHFEVSLRYEDENGELVKPEEFLPAAERYNLSTAIDQWVIVKTIDWLTSHPAHLERLSLWSINLSGHSLSDEQFLEFVIPRVTGAGIAPSKLCFEITETVAIADIGSAGRFIRALKAMGFRFALDDFGSGLSSFAYLKALPVDLVKIDGSFIRNIVGDPVDRAMVKSITEMGHVLGKKIVAEFVEDDATLSLLRELGVDYAQGYYLGRPRPLESFAGS